MSDKLTEKVQAQEEALDLLVKKVAELEARRVELPEIKIPDHSAQLNIIQRELSQLKAEYPVALIGNQVNRFEAAANSIPKKITREYHFHFQDGSRGFIISMIGMILLTSISVVFAFQAWSAENELEATSIKYRMIRQYYPVASRWADSEYNRNPAESEKNIIRLEQLQTTLTGTGGTAAQLELAEKSGIKRSPNH